MKSVQILSSHEIKDIESKVQAKLGEMQKTHRVLREEVWDLLEQEATLLKYPIQDDELCAFVCVKSNRTFVYINTYLPKEKQLFAAAHELYHIWFDQDRLYQSEMLNSKILENDTEDVTELKANLFAAMFLVPTNVLQSELKIRELHPNSIKVEDIVKLMALFYAPYKTLVRRLHEINFMTDAQLENFLSVPDRDETSGVILIRKKLQLNDATQDRTKDIFFEGFVENSISAFEKGEISEEKLRYHLSLVDQSPEDFQLFPTVEEDDNWEDIMEDYDGDD